MGTENQILQCLFKNIEESVPINVDEQKIEWATSLEGMTVFTFKEVEDHKKESGKNGGTKRQVRQAFSLKMSTI